MHGGHFTLVVLVLALLAPTAAAEFGPESDDGYPISVDGVTMYPPVIPVVSTQVPAEVAHAFGLDAADPLNKVGPFTLYPYYPILTAEVQRLARDHPDLVKLTSGGKSTAGLDLWLLEIADFARIESGEGLPLEKRERIYFDGGTHSNEYSGVYFTLSIAQFLLDDYATNETAKWIVENRHVWVLPLVNPDGSNAFGRLNAKAININRNFPGTWGTVEEDPVMNNPGPEPGSEVETRVIMNLLDTLQPDYVNSIHCCGNLWLHPYGAEQLDNPADMQMYTRTCDEAFMEVREFCGEIWSTIYPASGTTADEGYERVGAASWSYEMSGRGRIAGPWAEPVTREQVHEQEHESWNGVLHAMLNVEKYGARPQVVGFTVEASRAVVTLENVGYGNLTSANVTVGATTVPVPFLMPGERATLEVPGTYGAGELAVTLDFVKRERHQTPGLAETLFTVVEEGGRLVATPADGEALETLAADAAPPLAVPGPGALLALLGLVAVALVLRRR